MSIMASQRFLVVISFYEPRTALPLEELVYALSRTPAGADFDIVLIVNRTTSGELKWSFPMDTVKAVVSRPNEGMNIGAWDHGWRAFPDYDGYLFLQDECELKSECWLKPFIDAAKLPAAGLVGESWNSGWDRAWKAMRTAVEGQQMAGHNLLGVPSNRVDVYLEYISRQGVFAGQKAGHLRSLAWFANRETLVAMNGFLHGANYGECIASEIAASKQVESLGLSAKQVDKQPFRYFGHKEWRQDADGRWAHRPTHVQKNSPAPGFWRTLCARLRASIY
jgi:hypothetical protein